jgi:hypothetical protein
LGAAEPGPSKTTRTGAATVTTAFALDTTPNPLLTVTE